MKLKDVREFAAEFRETGYYRTPKEALGKPHKNGLLTSLTFHWRGVLETMVRGGRWAKQGIFDNDHWAQCGLHMLWETERLGTEVIIEGFENLKHAGPVVFVANHMSLYETFTFPPLMLSFGEIAIVLKKSLLNAPFVGRALSARLTIPLGREDPRADLKEVLSLGEKYIRERKASVLLYPQGTRQSVFDVHHFNTLGVKLAMNAGVPVVPIAEQTGFLGVGKYTKDFGPVDTSMPVRFACGPILPVTRANAKEVQAQCIDFIATKLESWGRVPVIR